MTASLKTYLNTYVFQEPISASDVSFEGYL